MQEAILAFWFGPTPDASREEWFRKDDAFDAEIRTRFEAAVIAALAGQHVDWAATARGSLALVLLLDQFTRNIYRGTARAFAGDQAALHTAETAIAGGLDLSLRAVERWFLYMPFQHAEDRAMQRRSLELFGKLALETGLDSPLEWAGKHERVVARFGRFPHRNAVLGRPSTPEEEAFLREPGSRF
ncbi:MAG: DUF924 domain-containing protein [Pseudomonadota bacterium]|nr:DUF924 domain-containing protein [Pseudomonadota bacterium]